MTDTQIVGYVLQEEAERFGKYAAALSLDASAVANLLLVREISAGRLGGLIGRYPAVSGGRKIVAHLRNVELKQGFADHAEKFGLKATPAASSLFRAELVERWLEKTVHNR